MLAKLQALREALEDYEASTDAEALLLVEAHNLLARVEQILRAFEADAQPSWKVRKGRD
jgi:hypothetical protein